MGTAICRSPPSGVWSLEAPPAQPRHPVGPVIHQPDVLSGLNQQGRQQTAQGPGSDYGDFH